MTWELRWHPFRAEWVLFTAHRGARPWIGEVVAHDEVEVPAENALAPLGRRIDATNPDYRGVFVFTNDLSFRGDLISNNVVKGELYIRCKKLLTSYVDEFISRIRKNMDAFKHVNTLSWSRLCCTLLCKNRKGTGDDHQNNSKYSQ